MDVTSRHIVDLVLFGPSHDRRQIQDSPILGDVWAEFANRPAAAVDLLITPHKSQAAGPVAQDLLERIRALEIQHPPGSEPQVAYLQGIIAARLYFVEVLAALVPMTTWWEDRKIAGKLPSYVSSNVIEEVIGAIVRWAHSSSPDEKEQIAGDLGRYTALDRYIGLAAIILDAGQAVTQQAGIADRMKSDFNAEGAAARVKQRLAGLQNDQTKSRVWQVSLNRRATLALEKSVPAVKADAAKSLFNIKCNEIVWAVLDSGIDSTHTALQGPNGSRVERTFDFGNIRQIVSLENDRIDPTRPEDRARIMRLLHDPAASEADINTAAQHLRSLANDAKNERSINWGLVSTFVELKTPTPPDSSHGTHVAGIIGAAKGDYGEGMCPDIKLWDFRVMGGSLQETEFAIIAALQYIRYVNERHAFITVHGANLSLSIPHDVRNFACGRTPICNECERLVASGVVVVAAAGNLGYHSFETKDGSYDGYTAFSITDPGNADGVITVGSTHRFWPHTYGVSFFSSRGPTGDGRLKPDLVAPGERIQSCLTGGEWGQMDGTSMAAPHVSGAAAMLMARHSELVGQPRRIKDIICRTATDLGRERSFQGHGMLDVLRAIQNI